MLFSEFRENDTLDAYKEFESVQTYKDSGRIPEDFHEVVDSFCKCGSERMVNDNLTILTCCDPRCYFKLGESLYKMLSYYGSKNIGPETCIYIMKCARKMNIQTLGSIVEIIPNYKDFEYLLGAKFQYLEQGILNIFQNKLKFYEMVQSLGIPGIDSLSKDFFSNYNSIIEVGEEILKVGIHKFFSDRGSKDLKKMSAFLEYFEDIGLFENLLANNLVKPGIVPITICITGPVRPHGQYMSRDDFVRYCNEISNVNGYTLFDISYSDGPVYSTYVIADNPSTSRKYRKGAERQSYSSKKILYTSTEFVDYILSEVEKCKPIVQESLEEKQ